MQLNMKIVSSLEKCFYNTPLDALKEKTDFVMFKNEKLAFQVAYRAINESLGICRNCPLTLSGSLAPFAKVELVCNILNMYPTYGENPGGEFITTEPGAYPDLIRPLMYPNAIALPSGQTNALWVEVELPSDFEAGAYDLGLTVSLNGEPLASVNASVTVVNAVLPEQTFIHTEWFYTDSIANYYRVKAFSEKHWTLIESFIKTAASNGINMILTPVFTPELDTYIGGERLTTQLADIELVAKNEYRFDFSKLDRWIDICLKYGVKYFEIPHFFTQWGAYAAPKIIVKVNGRKKKYFGWHTDSLGEEYPAFLAQLIPALLAHFKSRGLDKRCFFHVSDEPNLDMLEQYKKCKGVIDPLLEGYPIIDALSDFDFYKLGVLQKPVPHTRGAMPFIEAKVPGLWVYYCGGGKAGVSDRSVAMPSQRTRVLGVQLYYYDIEGFLHWGYNYYNSWQSYTHIDPFAHPDCGYFTPTGDSFLVYPGTDGTAWKSLRLNALREAMDDIRALQLYESRFGKEKARRLVMEGTDGTLDFIHYPTSADYLITLREKITKAFAD